MNTKIEELLLESSKREGMSKTLTSLQKDTEAGSFLGNNIVVEGRILDIKIEADTIQMPNSKPETIWAGYKMILEYYDEYYELWRKFGDNTPITADIGQKKHGLFSSKYGKDFHFYIDFKINKEKLKPEDLRKFNIYDIVRVSATIGSLVFLGSKFPFSMSCDVYKIEKI